VKFDGRSIAVMSSSSTVSLRHWLESILLPQYLDLLTDSGYDTMRKCAVLTSADLDRIGISLPGHKKRFLSQLAKFDLEPEHNSVESGEPVPVDAATTEFDDCSHHTFYTGCQQDSGALEGTNDNCPEYSNVNSLVRSLLPLPSVQVGNLMNLFDTYIQPVSCCIHRCSCE